MSVASSDQTTKPNSDNIYTEYEFWGGKIGTTDYFESFSPKKPYINQFLIFYKKPATTIYLN